MSLIKVLFGYPILEFEVEVSDAHQVATAVSLLVLVRAVPLFQATNTASVSSSLESQPEVRSLSPQNGEGSSVSGSGLDFYDPDFGDGQSGYRDPSTYQCFSGPASNFPPVSEWMDFNDMFSRNQQYSLAVVGDSGPEQGAIYNAIVQVSQDSKVDARLILAIILQEVFTFSLLCLWLASLSSTC